jgi:hypothetical protein
MRRCTSGGFVRRLRALGGMLAPAGLQARRRWPEKGILACLRKSSRLSVAESLIATTPALPALFPSYPEVCEGTGGKAVCR